MFTTISLTTLVIFALLVWLVVCLGYVLHRHNVDNHDALTGQLRSHRRNLTYVMFWRRVGAGTR